MVRRRRVVADLPVAHGADASARRSLVRRESAQVSAPDRQGWRRGPGRGGGAAPHTLRRPRPRRGRGRGRARPRPRPRRRLDRAPGRRHRAARRGRGRRRAGRSCGRRCGWRVARATPSAWPTCMATLGATLAIGGPRSRRGCGPSAARRPRSTASRSAGCWCAAPWSGAPPGPLRGECRRPAAGSASSSPGRATGCGRRGRSTSGPRRRQLGRLESAERGLRALRQALSRAEGSGGRRRPPSTTGAGCPSSAASCRRRSELYAEASARVRRARA